MKNKEGLPGINPQTFELVLDKEWAKGDYILGCDPYEKEDIPINIYHKLRKLLGLKFKSEEPNYKISLFKKHTDGTIEYIK